MKFTAFSMACVMAMAVAACGGGGGSTGNGGGAGEGGSAGSAGAGGSGGSGGAGGGQACENQTSATVANHIIVEVSWPDTLGLKAGDGQMHIWTKADLTFADGNATGKARPCGSVIPALTKSDLAGGGMVQTEIQDAVWDSAMMPSFDVVGKVSGFGVGATIMMDPIASTVGCMLANPAMDPWPASGAELMSVDHDGDGKPGIKAIPRTDGEFQAPPLDINGALDPMGDRADEVYVATRTIIQLEGTRDTCKSAKGTANVTKVDSHVVGCHVKGKADCDAMQTKFVDDNQPKFTIKSASYEMVQVDAGATCADVRAALPLK